MVLLCQYDSPEPSSTSCSHSAGKLPPSANAEPPNGGGGSAGILGISVVTRELRPAPPAVLGASTAGLSQVVSPVASLYQYFCGGRWGERWVGGLAMGGEGQATVEGLPERWTGSGPTCPDRSSSNSSQSLGALVGAVPPPARGEPGAQGSHRGSQPLAHKVAASDTPEYIRCGGWGGVGWGEVCLCAHVHAHVHVSLSVWLAPCGVLVLSTPTHIVGSLSAPRQDALAFAFGFSFFPRVSLSAFCFFSRFCLSFLSRLPSASSLPACRLEDEFSASCRFCRFCARRDASRLREHGQHGQARAQAKRSLRRQMQPTQQQQSSSAAPPTAAY